jgi:hypothetical protein
VLFPKKNWKFEGKHAYKDLKDVKVENSRFGKKNKSLPRHEFHNKTIHNVKYNSPPLFI